MKERILRYPLLFGLTVLLMVALLLFWNAHRAYHEFTGYHQRIAQHSVDGAWSEIRLLLSTLRNGLRMVVDENDALLRAIAADPSDERLQERLRGKLAGYLPGFHTFTLTNGEGRPLTDEFGEQIGGHCRDDITAFSRGEGHRIIIHPGPAEYHFDVMVPWGSSAAPGGVFFVSFDPELIARIIRRNQMPGHWLALLREDPGDLIEVAAEGTRDRLGEAITLSAEMLARAMGDRRVDGTGWRLVDIASRGMVEGQVWSGLSRGLATFGGFAVIVLFMLWLVRREEGRRRRAEQALRASHGELERRVERRTVELREFASRLEYEMAERERATSLKSALQRVLREVALGRPLSEILEAVAETIAGRFPGVRCMVSLYDEEQRRLRLFAAPGVAPVDHDGLERMINDEGGCSCHDAAERRELVVRERIDGAGGGWPTEGGEIRASWSMPLIAVGGETLGTLCMLSGVSRRPDTAELEMLRVAADIAAIAIERHRGEGRMRQLSSVVEQTGDSVVITDADGRIEYVNHAFEVVTGYGRDEVMGRDNNILRSGEHEDAFYRRMWETILAGRGFRDVFVNRRKNGSLVYEEKTITPLKEPNGAITHFVATGKDITDRIKIQQRLDYLAHHDLLTGLPNRTLVVDRIEHAVAQAHRNGEQVAVLFLDLDRFKTVNDSLGHEVGDELLKAVAGRLVDALREGDTVARLGGDEFTVVLEGLHHSEEAATVAEKIIEGLTTPFLLGPHEIFIGTSIGIALYPQDAGEPMALLKCADTAMYRAKEEGGETYQFFTAGMSQWVHERLEMEGLLRHALERGEFRLVYQPRVELAGGATVGMEALLRWRSPELGEVMPDRFIPLLEEIGMIHEVGLWVLARAIEFQRTLGADAPRVSVNLSPAQFRRRDLVARIREVLERGVVDPSMVELEITENLLVENFEAAEEMLAELHRLGLRLALDDFGTGYASLSYLNRLPFDTIKIDRSFVDGMESRPEREAIIRAVVALARSLRLEVVAEGVENGAQLERLRVIGCAEAQGFHLCRPREEEGLLQWLEEERPAARSVG